MSDVPMPPTPDASDQFVPEPAVETEVPEEDDGPVIVPTPNPDPFGE